MRGVSILFVILYLLHAVAIHAKNCDIYVMDNSSWDGTKFKDRFMQKAYKELVQQKLQDNIVQVNDLGDMRYGINEEFLKANPDCCIKRLVIIGHGRSGTIGVGCGKRCRVRDDDVQHMSHTNKSQWEPIFEGIKDNFCKKVPGVQSGVFLYGCRTGCCQKGADLIYSLGIALGLEADVYAYVSGVKTRPSPFVNKMGSMLSALEKTPAQYLKYFDKDLTSIPYPTCTKCVRGYYTPRLYKPTKVAVNNCPCSGTNWVGIQNCVDNCQTSLGCYTGICEEIMAHEIEATPMYAYNPIFTKNQGIISTTTTRQVVLEKNPNYIIEEAINSGWDAGGVSNPDVLLEKGTYYMWYNGWGLSDPEIYSIGLASSTDGINWVRDTGNPVLTVPNTGHWADDGIWGAGVIKDGEKYRMWFTGQDSQSVNAIGYAEGTQPDQFIADSSPVLAHTDGYDYDAYGMWNPEVIRDGDHFKMYYVCSDGYYWNFCLATSTDGRNWSRHPDNPIFLTNPDDTAWDGWYIYSPSVAKVGGVFHMYYTGQDSNYVEHIGYASSNDGVNWTRSPNNPILLSNADQAWDGYGIAHSDLVYRNVEDTYLVYFRGVDADGNYAIGMAAAPSLDLRTSASSHGSLLLLFLPAIIGKK